MREMVDERCALAQDYGTSVAMEKTLMENSATTIETVGLLVGAAQSDTIYRDVYLRRATSSAGLFGGIAYGPATNIL